MRFLATFSLLGAASAAILEKRLETLDIGQDLTATERLCFNTTLDAFLDEAKSPLRNQTLRWETNGCVASPTHNAKFDFTLACWRHEFCSRTLAHVEHAFCNGAKTRVDKGFRRDMNSICAKDHKDQEKACRESARGHQVPTYWASNLRSMDANSHNGDDVDCFVTWRGKIIKNDHVNKGDYRATLVKAFDDLREMYELSRKFGIIDRNHGKWGRKQWSVVAHAISTVLSQEDESSLEESTES
ncbi:hypothetical protein HIM_05216 [Hirsutella minnesotensis 3608]|uniref:Uncharacterized protein n=1 Tax=Hirsutella minnesotensis 3608 TaxID=1043627 RepID=A0A0F7ZPD1_9HYPO|nr:hypothetical protein HIM_05216 [Hirsutella minnesotensis 3608]